MNYLIGIGISLFFSAIISYFWVRGIDHMNKHYPDYKGEDFLNWGEDPAPWEKDKDKDDNKPHIEGTV
jgi:hypothetical protein